MGGSLAQDLPINPPRTTAMPQSNNPEIEHELPRSMRGHRPIPDRAQVPSIDQVCLAYWECVDSLRRARRDGNVHLARKASMEHKRTLLPNLRTKCVALVECRLRATGQAAAITTLGHRIADDAIEAFTDCALPNIRVARGGIAMPGFPTSVYARESLIRCVAEAVNKWLPRQADTPQSSN